MHDANGHVRATEMFAEIGDESLAFLRRHARTPVGQARYAVNPAVTATAPSTATPAGDETRRCSLPTGSEGLSIMRLP